MWTKISGILAIIGGVLYGLLQRAKIKELKRDVSEEKAVSAANDKADEALIRGLHEESDTSGNDTYFK